MKMKTGWIRDKKYVQIFVSKCRIYQGLDLRILNAINECREKGLAPVCDAYKNGIPNGQELLVIYLRSIYQAIILSVIENDSVLFGFTGISLNEKIMQFKKIANELNYWN